MKASVDEYRSSRWVLDQKSDDRHLYELGLGDAYAKRLQASRASTAAVKPTRGPGYFGTEQRMQDNARVRLRARKGNFCRGGPREHHLAKDCQRSAMGAANAEQGQSTKQLGFGWCPI
jgi:hypothetical protein